MLEDERQESLSSSDSVAVGKPRRHPRVLCGCRRIRLMLMSPEVHFSMNMKDQSSNKGLKRSQNESKCYFSRLN